MVKMDVEKMVENQKTSTWSRHALQNGPEGGDGQANPGIETVSGRSEVARSLASRGRLAIITTLSSEGQVKPGIETLEREYEEDKKTSTKAKWLQRNSPVWAIYRYVLLS